jgi:hypothetical protein
MREAAMLSQAGDVAGAAAVYEQLSASSEPAIYRELATLKWALLELDTADPAQLEARLTPLAGFGKPWHYAATELLALVAQKKGDGKRAADLFKQLADDLQAPAGIRARAAEMLAVLGAGGADKAKG